jgi:hypothetical protein
MGGIGIEVSTSHRERFATMVVDRTAHKSTSGEGQITLSSSTAENICGAGVSMLTSRKLICHGAGPLQP